MDHHNIRCSHQDVPGTLPDPTISIEDMERYGYSWDGMLPLREAAAVTLFEKKDLEIFLLHDDASESLADSVDDIHRHADRGGIMGVHREDWNTLCGYREKKQEKKLSIRAQLAQDAKRTTSDKTAVKEKNHGMEI